MVKGETNHCSRSVSVFVWCGLVSVSVRGLSVSALSRCADHRTPQEVHPPEVFPRWSVSGRLVWSGNGRGGVPVWSGPGGMSRVVRYRGGGGPVWSGPGGVPYWVGVNLIFAICQHVMLYIYTPPSKFIIHNAAQLYVYTTEPPKALYRGRKSASDFII